MLAILIAAFPAGALADGCEDLWFTRNLLMDRAGYCFGSPLGEALFDNSDCIGKAVSLPKAAARLVAEIRQLERELQCSVETSATELEFEDAQNRRKLYVLPVRDQFESACLGWREGLTGLHAGPDATMPVVGRITDGDDLLFEHAGVEGWDYVTVRSSGSGVLKSAGWLGAKTTEESCRAWAG